MKKIGIITLTGNKNYGNKLQNYALQKIIEKNKFEAYTIWKHQNIINYKIKRLIKLLLKKNMNFADYIREKNFEKFNTIINNYYMKSNNTKLLDNFIDYYVIGSDQIWNPNVINRYLGIEILKNKNKKISYSASLGVSSVDKEYEKIIKENFSKENINKISVREEAGKQIIEKITNRKDIEVLIDPTMLLTSEEWDKVSKKPRQLKNIKEDKYILNYFLGELSELRKQEIERIAKENNCHIINILDKKDPFYTCGPAEFLYLEKNAFLICTDSFHSCVFSILFDTPFIIFDRQQKGLENMNSRLETLLSKFKLENRRFNGEKITKENLDHDYVEAYKILEKERKKSEEFLKKALDIE